MTVRAARPMFVSQVQAGRIVEVVQAIESVVAMPAYRQLVLENASDIARHDPGGPKGVFLGYDFHPRGEHLGLIEINTNAGGAMLNAAMARAHRACCFDESQLGADVASGGVFEKAILAMFKLDGMRVDLVYNKLTDFMLEEPDSLALRRAYLGHAVVVTPHPRPCLVCQQAQSRHIEQRRYARTACGSTSGRRHSACQHSTY